MADEYISREAFKAEVWSLSTHYLNEWDTLGVLAAADRIPAADVQPVRHGRWIGHDTGNGRLSIDEDTCSLCGSRFYQIAETGCDWNFCPNCGAKMDGDK